MAAAHKEEEAQKGAHGRLAPFFVRNYVVACHHDLAIKVPCTRRLLAWNVALRLGVGHNSLRNAALDEQVPAMYSRLV